MRVARQDEWDVERRGFRPDKGRAVKDHWRSPLSAFKRVEALAQARQSKDFETLAILFKRVKNITREFDGELTAERRAALAEPAETALLKEIDARFPVIDAAVAQEKYADAMRELGDYRARHGLTSWDETVGHLLARRDELSPEPST